MTPRQAGSCLLLLLALGLASCNSPGEETPTAVSTTSACPRTPSFVEAASSEHTPIQNVKPAAPYHEIYNTFAHLAIETNTSTYFQEKEQVNTLLREELVGKRVSGWQGWVVNTGIEAARSLDMATRLAPALERRGFIDDDPLSELTYSIVLISMEDPRAGTPTPTLTPEVLTLKNRGWVKLEKPIVVLTGARESTGRQICIGQQVTIEGLVSQAEAISYQPEIVVSDALVTIVGNSLPERSVAGDLGDTLIEMRRTSQFGPWYELLIFGDGTVIFNGEFQTPLEGYSVGMVSDQEVRRLIEEFEKANFFSMQDFTEYEYTHPLAVRLTLTRSGKTHSVVHFYEGDISAEKMIPLERKIIELVEPFQWVEDPGLWEK
jgi:hypothetical protein